MELAKTIRDVPDFPKEGILFKDITTLLKDPKAFKETINQMVALYKDKGITKVCGAESRGFIFGAPLALELGAGFVPIRKPGKLPAQTVKQEYTLEYGTDTIEMHVDAIEKGERVLFVDDLLATGGTAEASLKLLDKVGANVVACWFLIELDFLKGREKLVGYHVDSVVHF